jgi:hypothetical protein
MELQHTDDLWCSPSCLLSLTWNKKLIWDPKLYTCNVAYFLFFGRKNSFEWFLLNRFSNKISLFIYAKGKRGYTKGYQYVGVPYLLFICRAGTYYFTTCHRHPRVNKLCFISFWYSNLLVNITNCYKVS